MKIIYLHQYFRKPEEWGSTRSWYLAKAMAGAGHEVHLVAGYNGAKTVNEKMEGFTVHYLPIPYRQEFGLIKRGLSFLKFSSKAYSLAAQLIAHDEKALVYASSTPLTVGITALWLKRFKKIPYIFEVRDLWPEAPIGMGAISNGIVKSFLRGLAGRIYKNAEAIISLSPGISAGIKKYKIKPPVYELSNFSDTGLFKPLAGVERNRETYLRAGQRGVIYFGALGKANHLEYLLDIAAEAQKMDLPLRFFIAGDGSEKARLLGLSQQMQLANLHFLPVIPKNKLPGILSVMDFSYISFLDIPVLGTCSPNKLFDSLAAGKLCISNTQGWMKELLEEENCGFYSDPLKPGDFIDRIQVYLNDEPGLISVQMNARNVAVKKYGSEIISRKLTDIINSFVMQDGATY